MQEYLVILQILGTDEYKMHRSTAAYIWLYLTITAVKSSAYNIMLEANETGRFFYEDGGKQMYCTVCPSEMPYEESTGCKNKNQDGLMPGGGQNPMCKEGAMGGVIPGCGPLPMSVGLSWRTKSGRPVQVNSTVYEVYIPQCSQNSELNKDNTSFRCWETLRWDVDPADFRCTENDNPFCSTICIIGICAGIGALALIAAVILIVCCIYRRRRNPSVPTGHEDVPLEESTYTPAGQQSDTKGDSKGDFLQMKAAKQ